MNGTGYEQMELTIMRIKEMKLDRAHTDKSLPSSLQGGLGGLLRSPRQSMIEEHIKENSDVETKKLKLKLTRTETEKTAQDCVV